RLRLATLPPITLSQGHRVHIRVQDPQNLLSANEGVTRGAHLLIGVFDSAGKFEPAAVRGADVWGRDQEVYVPENADLHLSVFSQFYALSDASGLGRAKTGSGASSQAVTFRAAPGDGPNEFVLRGKN